MMTTFPVYGVTPADWTLDTSFDQWGGFNKQVLWVAEYGDEYMFWWDNWTNYYSAYKWVSSINSNKISPFFRVRKDTKLTDSNTLLGNNMNATNTNVNYCFCFWGNYIYALARTMTRYWNNIANSIVRLNLSDMSFSLWNTWTWLSFSSYEIFYANWKVFIRTWSASATYNWWTGNRLHVLNDDLTVDSDLTTFFTPNNTISCIFEQADGKVVMSWAFTTIWWTTQNRIVRYNTDWTVDTTFTTNVWTWPSSWALCIRQLSDWKLVLWWAFTTFNGTASQRIIVLNTDWTIATAVASWFNTGQVNTVTVDWSDNIFCWWTFTQFDWNSRTSLAKVSSTLVFDATYNAWLAGAWWTIVYSLDNDGTLLYIWCDSTITTNWSSASWVFSTDLINWTLDSNFVWWINAWTLFVPIRTLIVKNDYIYMYWWASTFNSYWKVRTFDWELTTYVSFVDKTWTLVNNLDKFYSTSWTFNIVNSLKNWNDLYVSASWGNWYWLVTPRWIVKFTNKIIDTNYIPTITASVDWMIYDGWIIAYWQFTSPKNRIVKLDSIGWVDATFDVWTGFNGQVFRITKLINWNYLVTGDFTTYKWVTTNRICLLDNVGSKIWTFVEWTWFSSYPDCKSLQLSNWNYLIYGNMTTYKWVACNRAIILDSTWTQVAWLSSNFNSTIRKAVEYDGKIYFAWLFTTFWATTVNYIACVDLATWLLDNKFWTWFNNRTNNLIVDSWWKLVVVWNFTSYNGNTVGYVARIFI